MTGITTEIEQVLTLLGWDVEKVASVKIEVTRASEFAPDGHTELTECWKHTIRNVTEAQNTECIHDEYLKGK
ncbi:hypothetical protein ACFWGN_09910 [Oerskovia sp. NPDC060338]|uniref:hypothetical protein n=1 Tax=Oerskovia sp. NPDC060338 TaxID=3347100 RepID=UPI00365BDC56